MNFYFYLINVCFDDVPLIKDVQLRAELPEVGGLSGPDHEAVHLQLVLPHLVLELLPQLCVRGWDLTVRHDQDICAAPLLVCVVAKEVQRPLDRLVDVRAALEAATEKVKELLHRQLSAAAPVGRIIPFHKGRGRRGRGGHGLCGCGVTSAGDGAPCGRQVEFLDLLLPAEGEEVALALLQLGPADALQHQRLGHHLPLASHRRARVQTQNNGPLNAAGSDLHHVEDIAWLVLHPADALVAQEAPLAPAAVPELLQDGPALGRCQKGRL
mmetsp:Transcript_2228/g.5141  ORF Transcript_2228/g.5141 Transcript_2228/m.5141 type:complete len:269 (-) Transcript_2228:148-954(-)